MRIRSVALLAMLCAAAAVLLAQDPQAQPRLQRTDLTLLGSFDVPNDGGADQMEYGSNAMARSAHGLYIGCNEQRQRVAEFSIPDIGGTATLLQPCTSLVPLAAVADDAKLGAPLLWHDRLILPAYSYYDAAGEVERSHVAIDPATRTASAWSKVGDMGGGHVGVYQGLVPEEWRALFGGPVLTGGSGIPIISRTSSGPAACVYDPDQVGRRSVKCATVLNYRLSDPLGSSAAGSIYQRSDRIGTIVFPSGTRSVAFVGLHGLGALCYGEPDQCNDKAQGYKGDHNYPYYPWIWIYDANDLLAVKRGRKRPWEPKPYVSAQLEGMDDSGNAQMLPGSAAYDPETRRLYIAYRWGGGPRKVYVWQIAIPGATPE